MSSTPVFRGLLVLLLLTQVFALLAALYYSYKIDSGMRADPDYQMWIKLQQK